MKLGTIELPEPDHPFWQLTDAGNRLARGGQELAKIAAELTAIRIILEKVTDENGDPPPKRGLTLAEMQKQAREAPR